MIRLQYDESNFRFLTPMYAGMIFWWVSGWKNFIILYPHHFHRLTAQPHNCSTTWIILTPKSQCNFLTHANPLCIRQWPVIDDVQIMLFVSSKGSISPRHINELPTNIMLLRGHPYTRMNMIISACKIMDGRSSSGIFFGPGQDGLKTRL